MSKESYSSTEHVHSIINRMVIQIIPIRQKGMDDTITVLCDDGSVFKLNGRNWVKLPNIPQD